MKRSPLVAAICALLALAAIECRAQSKPAAEALANDAQLKAVAWLAGGTWVTDVKGPNGKTTHVENRIRWARNRSAIEFNTDFNGQPHYNGFYAWDPAQKVVGFWYTSADGELTIGTAAPDADGKTLNQDFHIMGADGPARHLRSTLVRDSDDSYLFTVLGNKDGSWVQIFQTRYVRQREN